jgi:hypothetical protein
MGPATASPDAPTDSQLLRVLLQRMNDLTQDLAHLRAHRQPGASTGPAPTPEPLAFNAGALGLPVLPAAFRPQLSLSTVKLEEFTGRKSDTDAQNRARSSSAHFLNPRFAATFDVMARLTDAASKAARENLGYVEPPATQPYPERHYLEIYWREAFISLWRMAHLPGPDFDQLTSAGLTRIRGILTIICRIRWLQATTTALDRQTQTPEGALPWPAMVRYLNKMYVAKMEGLDSDPFNEFNEQLIRVHLTWLRIDDYMPSLHDDLQYQLIGTARHQLSSEDIREARAAAAPATPSEAKPLTKSEKATLKALDSKNMTGQFTPRCYLCLATDHTVYSHPQDLPITQPCNLCKKKHARVGPLATKCA